MSLILRYMQMADVAEVVAIDALSFDPPWSARSYSFEVSESSHSHMLVLEYAVTRPLQGWRRWLNNLSGANHHTEEQRQVVGYGGLWHITDEAHISTIAIHPHWRGRGWGEILLAAMVNRAITLQAAYIVLEVRVSNRIAQNLYAKYEFQTASIKPHYYHNNNEDAFDMRLDLTDASMLRRFYERYAALQERHEFSDYYSEIDPTTVKAVGK